VNVLEDADVEMIRRAEICRKILQLFEFVIGEEAHEAGGNSYFEILRFCKNARYRLALTATPFMRSDSEANMRLMAAFGHVGIDVSEKLLIDRGILARPIFKIVRGLPKPPKLYKSTAWQAAYRIGIVENIERNRKIVQEAARAVAHGLPVMILVQHKAHGKILEDLFEIAGIEARFIFGEHDNDRRRRALDGLKDGSIKVLIGSTILDVGVDVPAVGMVVLAGGGKAEVALRQRIGRGLRAKKFGPNTAFIVDFDDEWNGHLRDHARQRHAIIADTPGFAEGILAPGADFDFSGFARARAA
jgi:superfamily II DNA or RNA helicase